jgi:hypothetical protein
MAQKNADITMRLAQDAEAISSLLRESFGEFESIYYPESKTIHEPTQNKQDHIFPFDWCDFVDRLETRRLQVKGFAFVVRTNRCTITSTCSKPLPRKNGGPRSVKK